MPIRGSCRGCGTIEPFSETFTYGELLTANFRHLALGICYIENTFEKYINSSATSARKRKFVYTIHISLRAMPTEAFWVFVITSTCAFFLAVARICYKSKCKEIRCGCCRIVRDTETEKEEFEFRTLNHIPNDNDDSSSTKEIV